MRNVCDGVSAVLEHINMVLVELRLANGSREMLLSWFY